MKDFVWNRKEESAQLAPIFILLQVFQVQVRLTCVCVVLRVRTLQKHPLTFCLDWSKYDWYILFVLESLIFKHVDFNPNKYIICAAK